MEKKPVLMIHEVRDWMLKLPLENYVLTFDDGLFGQYHYLQDFLNIDTPKIFFISTNIININHKQSLSFPTCKQAHKKFFSTGTTEDYMSWEQITEIYHNPNCFIGGHSHHHHDHSQLKLKELYDTLQEDTETMMNSFKAHDININKFCFPYNKEYPLYREILKKHNVSEFFGDERVAIEDLKPENIDD